MTGEKLADREGTDGSITNVVLPTLLRTLLRYWLIELGLAASPTMAMEAQRRDTRRHGGAALVMALRPLIGLIKAGYALQVLTVTW